GTLIFNALPSYTGPTVVNAGKVVVDGSLDSASAVTVNAGAALGGTGAVPGPVTIATAGTLSPGHSPGILNTGSLALTTGAVFNVEIGGNTPGNGPGFYDQDNVTGTVSLGGATLQLSSFGGYVPQAGDRYVIVRNDGSDAVGGTFAGLAEGAV